MPEIVYNLNLPIHIDLRTIEEKLRLKYLLYISAPYYYQDHSNRFTFSRFYHICACDHIKKTLQNMQPWMFINFLINKLLTSLTIRYGSTELGNCCDGIGLTLTSTYVHVSIFKSEWWINVSWYAELFNCLFWPWCSKSVSVEDSKIANNHYAYVLITNRPLSKIISV